MVSVSLSYQNYVSNTRPKILGIITKILYSADNISFKGNLLCDQIPRITINKGSSLLIENNVYLRAGVEIRAHENSKIIIEKDVKIDRGVRLLSTNNSTLRIGSNSSIGLYSVFNGGDDIIIGNSCLISGFVYIQTSMHSHKKGIFVKAQGFSHSPINIGDDVWLGAHSTILPGCKLGKGSIVGSNAVVTKSISSNEIVVGVPAEKIKERN